MDRLVASATDGEVGCGIARAQMRVVQSGGLNIMLNKLDEEFGALESDIGGVQIFAVACSS